MRLMYLIIIAFFVSCKGDTNVLQIDKYLNDDGYVGFKNLKNKIIQTNYYDKGHNLIARVEYSRSGCNLVDSTNFVYNSRDQLVEKKHFTPIEVLDGCKSKFSLRDHVLYDYNKQDSVNVRVLKGLDVENLNKNKFQYVIDSMKLVSDYLNDINVLIKTIDVKNIKSKNVNSIKIDKYTYNEIPSILMQYGIPLNEYLKSATTYIKDDLLTKDEFNFENYHLIRVYSYKRNILNKVTIEVINNRNKNKAVSTEFILFKGL